MNKDRAKQFSPKLTSDLGKIDGRSSDSRVALYVSLKMTFAKASDFLCK